MKKYYIFLILLSLAGHAAQWSNPVIISDGFVPDFDIDPQNGHLHIVSLLDGVIYTETDANGNIISGPLVIPGTTSDKEFWNFGATVAVDKNGYPHVCFRVPKGNYLYDVKYTRKTASGWLPSALTIATNQRRAYVVRMAIDDQNRVHIGVGYDNNPTDGQTIGPIAYYRVKNTIIEKSTQDLNASLLYYRVDNRFEMTVGADNNIHILAGCPGYPITLAGPVTYFSSIDNGETFSTLGDISNFNCTTRNGAADIAADNKGYTHMIYGAKIDAERNNQPSLRYVRYRNNKRYVDQPITYAGEVLPWDWNPALGPEHGKNYGLGSIACSEDGAIVMCAYINRPTFYSGSTLYRGDLFVTVSTDSGKTWGARQLLAENVCNAEGSVVGRNLHLLRSYKNHFYVIYPHNYQSPKKIKMQYLRNVGDNPPVAHAGGPYIVNEGSTVSLNASGSTDSGQNPGIVSYDWDINNDGNFDLTTTQPVYQTIIYDDMYSTVKVRVTDNSGQTSEATTTLQVKNVAPVVEAGPDITINEGSTAALNCSVTDPGIQDTHTFLWNFKDGTTSTQQSPGHIYTNDGQFRVKVTVNDGNNGIGSDSLLVTVNNVAPIADAGGPYRASINTPIQLTGSAVDPSPVDLENLTFSWDLNNDSYYETPGQYITHTFTQKGEFIIGLKVQDNKASHTDTAKVIISNDPPVISEIPNQTIPEGAVFSPVPLDNYVYDPDQQAAELVWSVTGQTHLTASINNRILTVSTPDSNWYGSEKLIMIVTDPGGMVDSTQILFTVISINDAPIWSTPIPDFVIDEDNSKFVPLDSLWRWASDIDHPDTQLLFSLLTPPTVTWQMENDNHGLRLTGQKDWNGLATIIWIVSDPAGLMDSDTSLLTIRAVPDNPVSFYLIQPMLLDSTNAAWPDSIVFKWHPSRDPDNPNGLIYYILSLKCLDGFESRTMTVFDTSLTYQTDKTLPDGRYIWYVTAYVPSGLSIRSENSGFIIVGKFQTEDVTEAEYIPKEFALQQNYPNPFNPETRFTYHVPKTSMIEICIYNALGQKIRTLIRENQIPGVYITSWNGTDESGAKVSTGIYICIMKTGTQQIYRKIMLLQ